MPRLIFILCAHLIIHMGWDHQRLSAEVGRDCTDPSAECDPGEVCVADGQGEGGRLCTRSCSAVNPCPEDFECEPLNDLSLCLIAPIRASAGEACVEVSCDEGLTCIEGDNERVCAQPCVFQGSCPRGFACRLGQEESGFCLALGDSAPIGEPCDLLPCVEGASCLSPQGERSLSYCSVSCSTDEQCPYDMRCDVNVGSCRHPTRDQQMIGTNCPLYFTDEVAAGCGGDLVCEPSDPYPLVDVGYRGQGWCTVECGVDHPCPEGYGCVHSMGRTLDQPGVGICLAGVIDAPSLSPFQGAMGGFEEVPIGDNPSAESQVASPPNTEGSDAASGCTSAHGARWEAMLVLGLFIVLSGIRRTRAKVLSAARAS